MKLFLFLAFAHACASHWGAVRGLLLSSARYLGYGLTSLSSPSFPRVVGRKGQEKGKKNEGVVHCLWGTGAAPTPSRRPSSAPGTASAWLTAAAWVAPVWSPFGWRSCCWRECMVEPWGQGTWCFRDAACLKWLPSSLDTDHYQEGISHLAQVVRRGRRPVLTAWAWTIRV